MKRTHIVIHHSLSKDGNLSNWNAIRKYHTQTLGWDDVGYHWGIEKIGSSYEILMGRSMNKRGAHCIDLGMNRVGIGVCLIGNYDVAEPPGEAKTKLIELCLWLIDMYKISICDVLGHREVQALAGIREEDRKTCPGRLFPLEQFRGALYQTLNT